MATRRRRILLRAGLGLLAVAVLLQLVPYGRDHTNPPVTEDAPWPDGSMPPRRYVLVHPDAALSEEERQVLGAALEAMDR
jgi:hypothetical protein